MVPIKADLKVPNYSIPSFQCRPTLAVGAEEKWKIRFWLSGYPSSPAFEVIRHEVVSSCLLSAILSGRLPPPRSPNANVAGD